MIGDGEEDEVRFDWRRGALRPRASLLRWSSSPWFFSSSSPTTRAKGARRRTPFLRSRADRPERQRQHLPSRSRARPFRSRREREDRAATSTPANGSLPAIRSSSSKALMRQPEQLRRVDELQQLYDQRGERAVARRPSRARETGRRGIRYFYAGGDTTGTRHGSARRQARGDRRAEREIACATASSRANSSPTRRTSSPIT